MVDFDFISGENFRKSFEADYQELNLAMQVGAWKAVHVLAGSITEALLVDYLISSNYQEQPKSKDPLYMSLDDLISECSAKNILSKKTEQISYALKFYRNLIHPGRLIRLKENVDEDSANVAKSLVKIILKEVAAHKREKYGYTAEQIVSKIERDPSTPSILGHLLRNTADYEKERLLLNVIPQQYFYYMNLDEPVRPILT